MQSSFAAAPKKIPVWELDQSCTLYGPIVLYVGESAAKLIAPKQNFICVTCAPTWRVVLENTKRKVGVDRPMDVWSSRNFHIIDRADQMDKGKEMPAIWNGQAAVKVVSAVRDADPLKEKYEMLYKESAGRSLTVSSEEVIFSKSVSLKPAIQVFLKGLYSDSLRDGVILEHSRIYSNGRKDKLIQTYSMKRVMIDPSEFVYPKGFKTVDNVKLVTNDIQKEKDAVDLLKVYMDNDIPEKK